MNNFSNAMSYLALSIRTVVAEPPSYPFVGQKAVKSRIEGSPEIQRAVLVMLYGLQTETEQAKRDTEVKNRAGFMSSDAFHGSRLAEAIMTGGEVTAEDEAMIFKIATKYSKQLSIQLRARAMAERPDLAAYVALFSVT